jgi:DNA invertase Pin-like site-specific DNA recombinase
MGAVGIVLSRKLSRLSRTEKNWCHLLELCHIFNTLQMLTVSMTSTEAEQ